MIDYTEPWFLLSTEFWGLVIPMNVTSATRSQTAQARTARASAGAEAKQIRADARRNREAVLAAADEVFSEEGLSAPIDEVARRAGVGVGTVYRHFPTKNALFEAIVMARVEAIVERAEQLARDENPAQALFTHISELIQAAVEKKDLVDQLERWDIAPSEKIHAHIKQRLRDASDLLLRRAQAAGVVRADLSSEDLNAMVMGTCEGACCSFIDRGKRAEVAARMVEVLCAGLQAASPRRFY